MEMIGPIQPAFAEAEVAYRLQRIKDSYPRAPRRERQVRRGRLAGLLNWGRRPNPAPSPSFANLPPSPAGAPHHLVGSR
jgi:hypothetical protein